MTQSQRKRLGYGVGLRPEHYPDFLHERPQVDWVEAISENFIDQGGRPRAVLERVRAHFPVALHGVSLSVGSAEPFDSSRVRGLARLVHEIEPEIVSDHLCWTALGGHHSHDLLPLPFTEEATLHVSERVARLQDALGRQILLENVSSYVRYRDSSMPEWQFLTEVVTRADAGILLDVNNVFVSAMNHGFDPYEYIRRLPAMRVGQIHLAGHRDEGSHRLDTHDAPVATEVWSLFEYAVGLFGEVPTLMEWDDALPTLERLIDEAACAKSHAERALTQSRSIVEVRA